VTAGHNPKCKTIPGPRLFRFVTGFSKRGTNTADLNALGFADPVWILLENGAPI